MSSRYRSTHARARTHTHTHTHAHTHHSANPSPCPLYPHIASHNIHVCISTLYIIHTLAPTYTFHSLYMHTCIRLSFQTCINTYIHANEDINIIMQCTRLASNRLILILCCCAHALTYTHSFIHSFIHSLTLTHSLTHSLTQSLANTCMLLTITHSLTHSLTHWQKNVCCAHVYTLIDFLSQQLYSIWSHPLGIYEYLFNLISPTG